MTEKKVLHFIIVGWSFPLIMYEYYVHSFLINFVSQKKNIDVIFYVFHQIVINNIKKLMQKILFILVIIIIVRKNSQYKNNL